MKILDSKNNNFDNLLNKLLLQRKNKIQSSFISVTSIIKDVKKNGDKALLKYEKRFNKNKRDIGKLAIEKTKAIERIVNKGGDNAARCLELASGAEHTEAELKATKRSEINPECPALANPSYVPY